MPESHAQSAGLSSQERRAAAALGLTLFLRLLGLFMLLPVLALYVGRLSAASPLVVGLALGVYGLTQAVFQIPLGALSDRLGRKPVIVGGLAVFVCGSMFGGVAHSMWQIAAARALQGCGAVSGATLALASDLSRTQQRAKVMAIMGVGVGVAFAVAFVLGPYLDGRFGLTGLFFTTALLGVAAIVTVASAIPEPERRLEQSRRPTAAVFADKGLRAVFVAVAALHGLLAASFIAIPVALLEGQQLQPALHWRLYLPVIVVALVCAAPLIARTSAHAGTRHLALGTVALAAAELLLWSGWSASWFSVPLVLFFTAFMYLESVLPSLVSRLAPSQARGAALGAYASCQFGGIFLGGLLGGLAAEYLGARPVLLLCAVAAVAWVGTLALRGRPRDTAPL